MKLNINNIERIRPLEDNGIELRLHRNEKPDDWPQHLLREIWNDIPKNIIQRYPDPTRFISKLSEFVGFSPDNFIITSGIDEQIRTIIMLNCPDGGAIAAPEPSYAMYNTYAKLLGVSFHPISYNTDHFLDPKNLIEELPGNIKILFLPNPNQPIENCYTYDELRIAAQLCQKREILLVVDEAYFFFGAPTAVPLVTENMGIIVMRTFSKAFGAAGIRLGYTLGPRDFVRTMNSFRLSYETNSLSLFIGEQLLSRFKSDVLPSIRDICDGRDFLREECIKREFKAWGNSSNNVLIDLGTPKIARRILEELRKSSVGVKGNYQSPLNSHILVTCGSKQIMTEFLYRFDAAIAKMRDPAHDI